MNTNLIPPSFLRKDTLPLLAQLLRFLVYYSYWFTCTCRPRLFIARTSKWFSWLQLLRRHHHLINCLFVFIMMMIAGTLTFPGTQPTWTAPTRGARAGTAGSGPAQPSTGIHTIQLTKSIYILVSWKYFDESFCQTCDKNQTFTLDDIQFSWNNGSVSQIWKSLFKL